MEFMAFEGTAEVTSTQSVTCREGIQGDHITAELVREGTGRTGTNPICSEFTVLEAE